MPLIGFRKHNTYLEINSNFMESDRAQKLWGFIRYWYSIYPCNYEQVDTQYRPICHWLQENEP